MDAATFLLPSIRTSAPFPSATSQDMYSLYGMADTHGLDPFEVMRERVRRREEAFMQRQSQIKQVTAPMPLGVSKDQQSEGKERTGSGRHASTAAAHRDDTQVRTTLLSAAERGGGVDDDTSVARQSLRLFGDDLDDEEDSEDSDDEFDDDPISASSMIDHQLHSLLDNLDSVSGDSSNGAHTPAVDDSFSFGALGGGILSMPRFPSPSPMLGAAGAGTSSATSAGSDGLQSFATMLASDSLNSSISSDPSPSADSRYISADLPDSMNTPIQGRQSITAGAVPETLESVEESFVEVMAETNTPEPPPLTSRPTRTDSGMMESFDASMDMDDTDSSILMDDTPSGMADILAL